jgi:hypothetical protein
MGKILIKLKKIQLKKYDSLKKTVDLDIAYLENDKINTINKKFNLDESSLLFAKNLLTELKKQAKVKYNLNFDESFDNFVNVLLDEEDAGYTEERLATGLNRIKERIRGFRTIQSHENYINKFHDLNNYSIDFK